MMLERVLDGVVVTKLVYKDPWQGPHALKANVEDIQHDSRKVGPGAVYVAIRGARTDGHRFIPDVIAGGAVAVIVEDDTTHPDSLFIHAHRVKVVVPNARIAMARMARNLFGDPSRKLKLVGVTGTNGKTTTTHLVRAILEADGQRTGLLGTMGHHDGKQSVDTLHTTPEAPSINRMLSSMVTNGCTAAVMEVSSHALVMERVNGLRFQAATFTNLTQDHLDFHGSMERYGAAKKILFDSLDEDAVAVVNADDPYGSRMLEGIRARTLSYGSAEHADIRMEQVDTSIDGTKVTVRFGDVRQAISSPLIGRFNAVNMAAAFATAMALGIRPDNAAAGIASLDSVRGRFEAVPGNGWTAVIDYAHTPDALERVLSSLRELVAPENRVITVFGCGGDRDRGKRPLMGAIAGRLSDVTIVTSDNPRSEEPEAIIDQVMAGMNKGAEALREVDRRRAIRTALTMATPGDVVLIAGKGHETYQILGDTKVEMDDREEVLAFLRGAK